MSDTDDAEDVSDWIETVDEWLMSKCEVVQNAESTVEDTIVDNVVPLSPISDVDMPGVSHSPVNIPLEEDITPHQGLYRGYAFQNEQAPVKCTKCPGTASCSSMHETLFCSPGTSREVNMELPLTDSQKLRARDEFQQYKLILRKNFAFVKPKIVCSKCPGKEFSNKTELMQHTKWFHPVEIPVSQKRPEPGPSYSMTTACALCTAQFDSVAALVEHLAIIHPTITRERISERMPSFNTSQSMYGSHQCALCRTKYPSEEALDWHLTVLSPSNTKCCPFFNVFYRLGRRLQQVNAEDGGPPAPKRKKSLRNALVDPSCLEINSQKCVPIANRSSARNDDFCELCWYRECIRAIIRDFNQRILEYTRGENADGDNPNENQSKSGGQR